MSEQQPRNKRRRRRRNKRGGSGCFQCGQEGHFKADCPNLPANGAGGAAAPGGQQQQKSNASRRGGGRQQKQPAQTPQFAAAAAAAPAARAPVQQQQGKPAPGPKMSSTLASFMTQERFADLPVAAETRRAMAEVLRYEFLSQVQSATLPTILTGQDVLAQAKTGTGKTLGFLIPTLENLVARTGPAQGSNGVGAVSVLIMSPTRELATQIAREAEKLLTFHPFGVSVVIGGTNLKSDQRKLRSRSGFEFLVATPGRLLDHLNNTPGFAQQCSGLRTLILDEADRMMDMGFRPEIEKILRFLSPPATRQTLLFSATIPAVLHKVAHVALRPGHAFINTVPKDEADTHLHVPQTLYTVPFASHVAVLFDLLKAESTVAGHKVMVFFPTARHTQFMAELMTSAGLPVLQIHSRKSQSYRAKVSDRFRKGSNLIIFSSDVSARGVDYPDVTLVLQVGITDREQYIHRVGRTARAGKGGRGVLLLCPFEAFVAQELRGLPLKVAPAPPPPSPARADLDAAIGRVARNNEMNKLAAMAYQAWLGFCNSNTRKLRWNKDVLVEHANLFSAIIGLPSPPPLLKRTVGKMGLKGVRGLRLQ